LYVSPTSRHFISLRPKYSPQYPVLKHAVVTRDPPNMDYICTSVINVIIKLYITLNPLEYESI
jgi:hypothetical protein